MDELYVVARRVLIDALEALGPHRAAVVVVGAQAIYLRVGEADLAVAPYTTDGDLALDPSLLPEIPPIERALADAGFRAGGGDAVGVWLAHHPTPSHADVVVQIDLLVPEAVSPGKGRRAARLRGHDPTAARIVRGLEGAMVDFDTLVVTALDARDKRGVDAKVAGPAALLVAKVHKLDERQGTARSNDKDALDVFRLLRGVSGDELVQRFGRLLADERSAEAAGRGLALLESLFHRGGEGTAMAVRAVAGLMDPAEVRVSFEALSRDVIDAVRRR